jgi:hypothetical protein
MKRKRGDHRNLKITNFSKGSHEKILFNIIHVSYHDIKITLSKELPVPCESFLLTMSVTKSDTRSSFRHCHLKVIVDFCNSIYERPF